MATVTQLPSAIVAEYLEHVRDRSTVFDALFRRDPMAEAERIGKSVAKLRSCSKAGRSMIADNRCRYAGLHPTEFWFRHKDEHLIPKHTPIGEVRVTRFADWKITQEIVIPVADK